MTTSQTLTEKVFSTGKGISKFWLQYFRENFQADLHDKLIDLFLDASLSKAEIARRIGRKPEQITRWLSAPSNLEAETISDLSLAMGYMPSIKFEPVDRVRPKANRWHYLNNSNLEAEDTLPTSTSASSLIQTAA